MKKLMKYSIITLATDCTCIPPALADQTITKPLIFVVKGVLEEVPIPNDQDQHLPLPPACHFSQNATHTPVRDTIKVLYLYFILIMAMKK
jgi:hypothetical protein